MVALGFEKVILAFFSVSVGALISATDDIYVKHSFLPRLAYSCFVCAIVANVSLATDIFTDSYVTWIYEAYQKELPFISYYVVLNFGVALPMNLILKGIVESEINETFKNFASLIFIIFLFYMLWLLYNTTLTT